MVSGELDAAAIVGLLADEDRRRVVAALTLGSRDLSGVAAATGLPADRVTRALGRLAQAGLVVSSDDGSLEVANDAFQRAARAALARPPRSEHAGEPDDRRKVLDVFVHDGVITTIPATRSKRLIVLDWLAQDFEPGVHYAERQVNDVISRRHADTATLRRYLVDEGMLDREAGEYWRAGGTVQ